MRTREIGSTRREVLRGGLRLAASAASVTMLGAASAAADAGVPEPQISFLSREAGTAALTRTPGDGYFANMNLLECRTRTRSTLTGLSLADARIAVRDYEAAAVRSFTPVECDAIRWVVGQLQPRLARRAPLYARTPWSFVKLSAAAEGGMPHTRGPHIVIPDALADFYVEMLRTVVAGTRSAQFDFMINVLVHEQTHVLERASPARFETLITDVFGFTRMTPAPSTPWLDSHGLINPDGPDVVWAFPLERIGGRGWVMPGVTVPDVPIPRMPEDFQAIGIEVTRTDGAWKVVEENGLPKRRDLDKIPGYDAHFPFPDEDFHPNEIAAVALSHWILQDVPDVDRRPLMPGLADWAKRALA